jgi:hypothetical protein
MQLINICDGDSLFGSAKLYGTPSRENKSHQAPWAESTNELYI